jgi:hypothetical protein
VSQFPPPGFPAIDPQVLARAARRTAYQNPRYDRITPVRLRVLQQLADGIARQAREIELKSPDTLARLVNLGLLDKSRAEDRLRQPWVYAITAAGKAVVERIAEIERRRTALSRRRAARAQEPSLAPAP